VYNVDTICAPGSSNQIRYSTLALTGALLSLRAGPLEAFLELRQLAPPELLLLLPGLAVKLRGERLRGAGEHIEHREGQNGRQVQGSQRRNNPSEHIQIRVTNSAQRIHNDLGCAREPRQHQARNQDSVVNTEEVEHGARDHELCNRVPGNDGRELATPQRCGQR